MKKFLEEVVKYFWIPLIMALVSYIFFQLRDVLLGIITLVTLSAVYTLVRLYFAHKKWWLLIILVVVGFAAIAFFLIRAPSITLSISGQKVTGTSISFAAGSVSVSPAPQPNGLYTKNAIVILTADPASGYDWKSWSGTNDDSSNPTTVTMVRNKQVKVTFEPRFSLTISNQLAIGSGVSFNEGSVSVSPASGDDDKYAKGTVVILTANPAPGYGLRNWSGTGGDTLNPTAVTISSDKHVTVTFELRFPLTINNQAVTGSSTNFTEGLVLVNPAPKDDSKYPKDSAVTLTASPASGYRFVRWGADASGNVTAVTITMNSSKNVTAVFAKIAP